MNKDTLFKISDELATKLKEHFASSSFQETIKELKDVNGEDNGTFRMIISTDDVDRHGEVIEQDGWQLENYLQNPVVLWGHDSYAIPVGITDKLIVEVTNGRKALVAEGRFASHEFAQTLRKLYEAGMLKASSVGFIPLEYEANRITKAELLEWSFVSIPANQFALDARGFDLAMLQAKGILKDVKEGDEVITDDDKKDDENVDDDADDVVADEEEAEDADYGTINTQNNTLSIIFADGKKKVYKMKSGVDGFIEKAGRVLSKANKEKIINAKLALEEVIKIAEDGEATDEGKTIDTPADEKSNKEVQEAEDFLKLRKGLQGVATYLQDILTQAKSDAQSRGIRIK